MADAETTCAVCGVQFPTQGGKKYCGSVCKGRRPRIRHNRSATIYPLRTCFVCGCEYRPKRSDRTTACSRECGYKWMGFKRHIQATCGRVFVRVLRRPASTPSQKASVGACGVCGKDYERTVPYQRYCGPACSGVHREMARQKYRESPSRRVAKKRRKAMERGARTADRVDPLVVFDRDGWRCQICKAKTPTRLRGTIESRAPELDHIVALANGGSHSYGNVQCLCRACNIRKGATDYGQLHLFASG